MLLQTGLLGPLTTHCDLLWSGLCKTTVGWEGGLNQRLQSCDTWAWCPFTDHQSLLTEAYRQKLCQFNRSLIGHFVRLVDAAWLRTGCATEKTKRLQCTSKSETCGTSKKWDDSQLHRSWTYLKKHTTFFWGGPCLYQTFWSFNFIHFPIGNGGSTEVIQQSCLVDLAASKACSLLDRFARPRGVVGMFGVGYIYHICYVYTKHGGSEKAPRKWRLLGFCIL